MVKDDRIGYFREPTVFDTLNRYGIDWKYMESNVSILRLFDNYRIDIKNVAPLRENDDFTLVENNLAHDDEFSGLELLLKQNTLPRVVFIDPRFSDAPPLKKANDDLPPANIKNGQQFIKNIYDRLFKSQHAKDISLLITYDEHGGFFDHVPPPGTKFSNISVIDKIHPDGPEFLGVRVPTILVSPFVAPHSVSHTVFDHTSILKTILVHNRSKIPRDAFGLFSERVKKAAHIGMALDMDVPREMPISPALFENEDLATEQSEKDSHYRPGKKVDVNDFHEVMRAVYLPEIID
jgi:phospholipase C